MTRQGYFLIVMVLGVFYWQCCSSLKTNLPFAALLS